MTGLKSFDRVAHLYDETRGMPPDVTASIADGIAAIFREVDAQPLIVELGVGTGRIAAPLAERGVRVLGLDISPRMLGVLREKRVDIDVVLAEAAHPPLRAGSFHGALFVHILHLVPDAEATVRATLSLMRRGGVVVHGGDDRFSGPREEADAIVRRAVQDLTGVNIDGWDRYTRSLGTLQRLLREAGANVEQRMLGRWDASTTARTLIERLGRRDYSASWQIPAESVSAIVARVTPQLEAFCGGLDAPLAFERSFSATVGRLPA